MSSSVFRYFIWTEVKSGHKSQTLQGKTLTHVGCTQRWMFSCNFEEFNILRRAIRVSCNKKKLIELFCYFQSSFKLFHIYRLDGMVKSLSTTFALKCSNANRTECFLYSCWKVIHGSILDNPYNAHLWIILRAASREEHHTCAARGTFCTRFDAQELC